MTNDMLVNGFPVFSWRKLASGHYEIVCREEDRDRFKVDAPATFTYCETDIPGIIGRVCVRK
jgi:hypothetical protein